MEPQPRTFDDEHRAEDKKSRKRERDRLIVSCLRDFRFIVFLIVLPSYFFLYDMPPEFSIQLAPIRDLDAPAAGASISPASNVTLHAGNRRGAGRCYHGNEALVSYAGFTIASGRVPGFCVPGKGAREMRFQASADGVGLPEHVLDRMAMERRVGATQLEVEVKLSRRDDGSDRPMWIWCARRMDGAQPPNVTPCTVLGLQNWFSIVTYD
ncbi:hypothetical protein ACP70R_036904 [Stipagrostis hirtigluma subsp. patula]